MTRIFSEKNILNLRKRLLESDWSPLYTTSDANECYNCFVAIYLQSFNECFKLTKVSRRRSKDAVWITQGLKTSSRTKNNLYKIGSFENSIIPVENGELASGLVGEGRMAEPETIISWLQIFFS